jgi:hypothetical protein
MRNRARAYMCLPYSYGKPTSCCVVVVLYRQTILERGLLKRDGMLRRDFRQQAYPALLLVRS